MDQVRAQASEQHLDAHIHDLVELAGSSGTAPHASDDRRHPTGMARPRPLGSPAGEEKLLQRAERIWKPSTRRTCCAVVMARPTAAARMRWIH